MSNKQRIFSGMRPTGNLHIGHLSVIQNWVNLQDDYECFFSAVDLHALTTAFEDTSSIQGNIWNMILDWLAVGVDPEKNSIFVQSQVKQHVELHLLLSMITPLPWVQRCPTFKEQVKQLGSQGKDISTYGFLGYPVLMASDILVYRSTVVPVGEDQIPHIEMTREIARRFNYLFKTDIFPEPKEKLSKLAIVPGVDGRKMSKSYNNYIAINSSDKEINGQVRKMVTDPLRIHKNDPGNPDVCIVYTYHKLFNQNEVNEISEQCKAGEIGCMQCKKRLVAKLVEMLTPIRDKRDYYENHPDEVNDILKQGKEKASIKSEETMCLVREAMKI